VFREHQRSSRDRPVFTFDVRFPARSYSV
jgi:hypothetical protein